MKRVFIEKIFSVVEDESIPDSIDKSSTDNDSDDRSISTNNIEDIRDGHCIHLDIKTRNTIFKVRDHIRKA